MVVQDAPIPTGKQVLELRRRSECGSTGFDTDFPVWEQAASIVLYCLASYVHDQMLRYIRDAKTLKEAWEI